MDAALLFLLVFLVYTVLLVVALMRVRQLSAELSACSRDIGELRSAVLTNATVVKDVADSQRELPSQANPEDLQTLLSNPLVQQMMGGE